ncbi:DivIVA domain-containing protein [Clostridium sp. SYSU_GA19001]|uniref:DivIVA domain-containing protein n=1 Tax=Clostridium caldaquaticum TaxID=2940653 RepID=UPI002076DBD1|nr:DivIVA domain-containing protein [Clostridium caldaquaticum]MCM8710208.1 DivIVA domain-containing protein [Clostridium caldaquaticum]
MGEKFKRAFLGYKIDEVKQFINNEKAEFDKLYKESNSEFDAVAAENKMLKEELENIKKQISSYKDSKDRLQNILYKSYIQAAASLYDEQKKLETMIKEKTDILESQKSKNAEIKASINKLLSEIKIIVED